MAKPKLDGKRRRRWRSAAPRPSAPPGSSSERLAEWRSAASASSRARSSAAGARSSASVTPRSRRPKSIRFPAGRKSGGALTLLVEGAHGPLLQHLSPMIIERVNRFFGYPGHRPRSMFRQGRPLGEEGRAGASAGGPGAEGARRGPTPDRRPRASRRSGIACHEDCGYKRRADSRCLRRQPIPLPLRK